ncbi:MAG: hypothetical protein HYR48_05930 [Gemmatimonadetes bacterium]|nr:hypothetical protein [Gemmatimonadota bacterium]
MTLADLPVLNPSTPAREAKRAAVVAAFFLVFGVLYALARAAAAVPPDLSASTDVVFGFAFPRGWGIAPAFWSGSATWPSRVAAAGLETTLAVAATVVMAIALVVVMHPDILSRQGPQYVSPARRITTVAIAFVLAFLLFRGTLVIDGLFSTDLVQDPDKARRELVGLGAISALLFGGFWSFIGPKDFGRRIPLRISHGALGGLGVWAAITFATLLSSQPRSFLSSSLDTFYTLLTIDAAGGSPGATAGWAVSSDVLTAGVAMAVAGALLVVTAPQSLGPGNRRGSTVVAAILGAFLAVVALTTYSTSKRRSEDVSVNVVAALGLDTRAPTRTPIVLAGQNLPVSRRLVTRTQTSPTATADDCAHSEAGDDRLMPAATLANVQKLTAWLDAHRDEVTGMAIRVASCRTALLALRWDPEAARASVFLFDRPERIGPLTYLFAMSGLGSPKPAALRRILGALADQTRFQHGSEAATRFANYARLAGDTATEAAWRQRVIQPTGSADLATLRPRPAYMDGTVSGRLASARSGWRVGLLIADDPSTGLDPSLLAPRTEGSVLSTMVTAADIGHDGRFSFTGLRDGYYILALLSPENTSVADLTDLQVRGDPGVFRLDPARKTVDVGTVSVNY